MIFNLSFHDGEGSFGGVIEFRGGTVSMHEEVNKDFFDFGIVGFGHFFDKILNPNFGMFFLSKERSTRYCRTSLLRFFLTINLLFPIPLTTQGTRMT